MANYKKETVTIGTIKYVPEKPVEVHDTFMGNTKSYKFFITCAPPPSVIFEIGRETYSADPNVMAFYNDRDYDLIRFSKMIKLLESN